APITSSASVRRSPRTATKFWLKLKTDSLQPSRAKHLSPQRIYGMDTILDAHCHLADPRLYPDLDGALARAAAAAVEMIVAVGAIDTIETDRLTVDIAERHSYV